MFWSKKKTHLGFCLSIALSLSVTLMSYADAQHLFTGGYPASVVQSLKYSMDGGDSTYQYSIMDSGAQAWNNISTKVRVSFSTSGARLSIHKTYIGNDGLFGEMMPYKSDYSRASTSDIWYVCAVNLYDNQMHKYGFNTYQKKATCTHEVGHSLSLAHTNDLSTVEVMDQRISKALSPTDIDKGHLKLKWGVLIMRKLNFRNITIIGSVCLTLAIGIASFAYYNTPGNVIKIHGDHTLYNSVEELENYSDVIIVAKAVDEFCKYTPTLTYTPEGRVNTYNTLVDMQVIKPINGSVSNAESIKVIEHAAYLSLSPIFGEKDT